MRMPEEPRPLAWLVLLESKVSPVATMVTAERTSSCFVFMAAVYGSSNALLTNKGYSLVTFN
jgi:hypothetical protein